jgi:hypothetical protein
MIRYIYTFFVGLFLAIFIGLGIAVFYEQPTAPEEPVAMQSIGKEGPTEAQQREINAFHEKQKTYDQQMAIYNRNVSIIVLICAVVILAVALLFTDKLGIVADGILLGGIFSLLYGIGRGMATDNNKYRFAVAAVGLAVTIILGYFKFTHRRMNKSRIVNGSILGQVIAWLIALAAVGGIVYGMYVWQYRQVNELNQQVSQLNRELSSVKRQQVTKAASTYTSQKGVTVKIYTPAINDTLVSPVIVMGEVPGNWSFEASFPVKILDAKGNVVAKATAQLLGEWMTTKLVPFSAKLTYASAVSGNGVLLLQKDNPSGMPQNDDTVSIPIHL